jgi:EAL domain-containing protein (putative c-di-GMP-specific phosphodiesterase class I)
VRRLCESSRDRAIARSIIELGRSLGLGVVGEGVTDEATRDALVALGCALGQGSLFAEPLPPPGLAAILRTRGARGYRGVLGARVPVPAPAPLPPPSPRRPAG